MDRTRLDTRIFVFHMGTLLEFGRDDSLVVLWIFMEPRATFGGPQKIGHLDGSTASWVRCHDD